MHERGTALVSIPCRMRCNLMILALLLMSTVASSSALCVSLGLAASTAAAAAPFEVPVDDAPRKGLLVAGLLALAIVVGAPGSAPAHAARAQARELAERETARHPPAVARAGTTSLCRASFLDMA